MPVVRSCQPFTRIQHSCSHRCATRGRTVTPASRLVDDTANAAPLIHSPMPSVRLASHG